MSVSLSLFSGLTELPLFQTQNSKERAVAEGVDVAEIPPPDSLSVSNPVIFPFRRQQLPAEINNQPEFQARNEVKKQRLQRQATESALCHENPLC